MRNKVYFCSIKTRALGFNKLLESIFCLLLVVEAFSLQKVVEMLEEVVVSWREVKWPRQKKANFVAQFVQLLKHWLCNVQLCIVMEKNWALSVDRCWLQALQFSVRLIDLLSILLRYKDFAGIQKAVMDQTHQIVTMTFLWSKFCFGKFFGASSKSSHWAGHHWLLYTIHFSLHITIW